MKCVVKAVFFIFLMGCSVPPAYSSDTAKFFIDGVGNYKNGDYAEAASNFQRMADGGVKNSELFYNLGNAYYKTGDYGRSVLYYEKALRLSPEDPDLNFNYDYVKSLLKDQQKDDGEALKKILFFWNYILSATTISILAIVFNAVFWGMLILRKVTGKRIFKIPAITASVFAFVLTFTTAFNYYESAFVKKAVILPEKVSVRSGLSENSTELFVLHAGTKVRIDKSRGDYVRIFFSEGKIGWIASKDAGVI